VKPDTRPDHINDPLLGQLVDDLDRGFEAVYATHRRAVYSTALRATGRPHEAEDLTAETFLRAYQALGKYSPTRTNRLRLRPWLITIALNSWRNQARTASRRPNQAVLDNTTDPPSSAPSVEAQVEMADANARLAQVLYQLPEKQRLAVVLRHVSDMSIEEISEVLGVPEGTTKSHISRGLARLRQLTSPAEQQTAEEGPS
jgi:RNA polymerase sigma factor (sigma-70 family)